MTWSTCRTDASWAFPFWAKPNGYPKIGNQLWADLFLCSSIFSRWHFLLKRRERGSVSSKSMFDWWTTTEITQRRRYFVANDSERPENALQMRVRVVWLDLCVVLLREGARGRINMTSLNLSRTNSRKDKWTFKFLLRDLQNVSLQNDFKHVYVNVNAQRALKDNASSVRQTLFLSLSMRYRLRKLHLTMCRWSDVQRPNGLLPLLLAWLLYRLSFSRFWNRNSRGYVSSWTTIALMKADYGWLLAWMLWSSRYQEKRLNSSSSFTHYWYFALESLIDSSILQNLCSPRTSSEDLPYDLLFNIDLSRKRNATLQSSFS